MVATLDIVIVNWNSGDQLDSCLTSICDASVKGLILKNVVIVDNGSVDDSLSRIDKFKLPLKVIENSENNGFAKGCNQGAKGSKSKYILFLNPDARLFKESLRLPVSFMESPGSERYGICGIQLVDEEGCVTKTCARFPTLRSYLVKIMGLDRLPGCYFRSSLMSEWDHCHSGEVDQIMGAFLLVRNNVFQELRGFDENYFVYFEEVDLSKRMVSIGFRSYYLSAAKAFHKGCGTSDQIKALRLSYNLKSRLLYGSKHFSRMSSLTLLFSTLIIEPVTRSIFGFMKGSGKQVGEVISGYSIIYRQMPDLLNSMKNIRKQ